MKYKAVIFDLDGTLLDTLDDIKDSVNKTMREFNLKEQSRDEVKAHVGNRSAKLIEQSIPDGINNINFDKILNYYSNWYESHCNIKTAPYPGIISCMEKLKASEISCAVVSNKPQSAVTELSQLYFAELASVAIGESPGIRRKPAPDTVIKAMEMLNADPAKTVYVGDSEVDIKTAEAAGIDCISVLWGFRSREELLQNGASVLAEDAGELISALGL